MMKTGSSDGPEARRDALARIRTAAPEEWQRLRVVAMKAALLDALTEVRELDADASSSSSWYNLGCKYTLQEGKTMAKKPRPRVQGKVVGNRMYPWEAAERGRRGGLAVPREEMLALAAKGRAVQVEAARIRKANGEFRRVVFHISLTGNYPTRLMQAAEARDGNCSALVREALDYYWENPPDLP